MDKGSTNGYTATAISLHWLTVLLIIAAFPLGVYMHELPNSPLKLRLYSYHKWIGVTVFALSAARLIWRGFHPAPALPSGMPAWEQKAAKAAHWLLYALIFIIPVIGWLMSSAHGFQTVYLGVLPIPDLLARDKGAAEGLKAVHELLNMALLATVVLHAAAALKHHFINKDDVLKRMLKIGRGSL